MAANGAGRGEAGKRSSLWRYLPIAVIAAGLAFAYALGWQRYFSLTFLSESSETLKAWVAARPVMAPVAFFVSYALAVAFSIPAASVLTVFAGFLFGWFHGGLLVAVAATLGATAIFLAARSAFGDVLRRRVSGRAARMTKGFEDNAFGYLLALRLAPVFPFFVVNIAPALFNVPVRVYVAATLLGILPGTFAYAWLGEGVDSVLQAARAAGEEPSVGDLVTPEITLAFILLALVAAVPTVVRSVRGRLSR